MTDREVNNVKGIMILALLFVAGCSAYVPLEQLEAEALVTGDWSKVDERQRIIARRNLRSSISCPPGTIGYCEVDAGAPRCSCVEKEIISSFLQR
jgi:hypothetical protein